MRFACQRQSKLLQKEHFSTLVTFRVPNCFKGSNGLARFRFMDAVTSKRGIFALFKSAQRNREVFHVRQHSLHNNVRKK